MKKNYHSYKALRWGIGAVVFISLLLYIPSFTKVDEYLANRIYNYYTNPPATFIAVTITDYTIGSGIFGPLLVVLLLYIKKIPKNVFFLSSYFSLLVIRYILQSIVVRPRPFLAIIENPYLGMQMPYGTSFPSFHAMSAFFIAYMISTLFKLKKTGRYVFFALAVLVGLSRIYLGAHYPLDVAAGSIIGLLWGHICFHILPPLIKKGDK